MGNLFEYEEYTEEQADAEIADMQSASFFKFEVGQTLLRVPPSRKGERLIQVTYNHYLEGDEDSVSVNCPRMMTIKAPNRERCPICEVVRSLDKSGAKADQELAKTIAVRRRVFMNAIIKGQEEKGVQIVPFGKVIHEQIAEMRRDNVAGGNFSDPFDGFEIWVRRKGTGKKSTRYTVGRMPERGPLAESEEEMAKIVNEQPNLSPLARWPSYGEVAEAAADVMEELGCPFSSKPSIAAKARPALPATRTAQDEVEDEFTDPDDELSV